MKSSALRISATAILLTATLTPVLAQDGAVDRRQYALGCALIKEIGAPIERKASRNFSKRWPKIGEYQGYPVYQFSPEPALSVIMVLGEQDKKLVSEARAGKAYLLRHHINAASLRRALQLNAQQALPDKVGCDLQEIALKGGMQLESLTFYQMID